jgi:phosphatidylglycerophosphate synthase
MNAQNAKLAGGRPSGRPPEMNDWLNAHIFHPVARLLAIRLQPTGITPNMVSVIGGLCIVVAGLLYTELSWSVSALCGFIAHSLWHVFDGADGDLARLTGKTSPRGEMIDGACDYFGHIALYIMLAASIGGWGWWIAAAAGASRIVQSNHSESQRRTYLWRVYGIPWLKHAKASSDDVFHARGPLDRLLVALTRLYLFVSGVSSPLSERADILVSQARMGEAGFYAQRICRQASRTTLRLQTALGANPRTVALGASMAAGSPLWFFLFECTLLNALLVWSILHQRHSNQRLVARLETRFT